MFRPSVYRIRLEPDLATFHFLGAVEITGHLETPARTIELHAAELRSEHRDSTAGRSEREEQHAGRDERGPGSESELAVEWQIDEAAERLTLVFDRDVTGPVRLTVWFTGFHNERMVGFYRARFFHGGEPDYVAVTQFEKNEARRAFPCVDHPAAKAFFDIELAVPKAHLALSNTPASGEEPLPDGRKLIRFERTPRMSTYLLFFGAGPFETVEDRSFRIPVRIVAPPGQAKYGADAVRFAQEALEFGEAFTGFPFPIGKMDLIACPDFAFGAMENYGAITYRENLVLNDPAVTTRANLDRIGQITTHEVAHMWFGNLVSPAEWKYIWLNEAFATYFGYLMTDAYHPDWASLERFVSERVVGALMRDSLPGTIPIELPGTGDSEFSPGTAPIVYSKAGAILRMFHGYLGETAFRAGVREYLGQFAQGCADTEGYLESFSKGVAETPKAPSFGRDLMAEWIRRPGYPIVRVRREGNRLHLLQERFVLDPEETMSGSASDSADEPPWSLPVTVRAFDAQGRPEDRAVLLSERRGSLDLPDGCVTFKVNADQTGFYRVAYEPPQREDLGRRAAGGMLNAFDRFGLIDDLWAQLCAGELPVITFLDFAVRHFAEETAYLPLDRLCTVFEKLLVPASLKGAGPSGSGRSADESSPFSSPGSGMEPAAEMPSVAEVAQKVLERAAERIGIEAVAGEPHPTALIRTQLSWTAFAAGLEPTRSRLIERFERAQRGETLPADVQPQAFRAGAAAVPGADDWIMERVGAADTPEAQRQHLVAALGCLPDAETIEKALDFVTEEVPARNRPFFFARAGLNPAAAEPLWEWLRSNLDSLTQMHPFHLGSILLAVVPTAGLGRAPEMRRLLDEWLTRSEMDLAHNVRMAGELLAVNESLAAQL